VFFFQIETVSEAVTGNKKEKPKRHSKFDFENMTRKKKKKINVSF